jgi:uncharacterized membrane protein
MRVTDARLLGFLLLSACARPAPATPEPPAGPHPCAHVAPAERAACLSAHGAILFAIGQEPGWTLVLSPGSFVLELDYGETRRTGVIGARRDEEGATRYSGSSGGAPVEIEVRERPCHDVMSGEPYPVEIVVTLPGRVARGCGLFADA